MRAVAVEKLMSVPVEYIETQAALPFDLFDEQGRLLLAAHRPLQDAVLRASLRTRSGVFGETQAVQAWHRRLLETPDGQAQPDAPPSCSAWAVQGSSRAGSSVKEPSEECEALVHRLGAALRQADPDSDWLAQVLEVQARMRPLGLHHLDEALFHLTGRVARHANDYSGHHAVHCLLIAAAVARTLKWDAELIETLEKAALTMNVAMRRLQDGLALQSAAGVDQDSREQIARHPVSSARLLADSGVQDPVWLEAVRLHHDSSLDMRPLEQLAPGQRLALLLRRVDVYSAVLSRRATRFPLTPMQAARRACLGPDGRPDVIGGALLKTVGLYPPGSFVQLHSREKGVVLWRGVRADRPLVAVLTNVRGEPLPEPRLRDTVQPGYAVRAGLQPDRVPVELSVAMWSAMHRAARKLRTAGESPMQPWPG